LNRVSSDLPEQHREALVLQLINTEQIKLKSLHLTTSRKRDRFLIRRVFTFAKILNDQKFYPPHEIYGAMFAQRISLYPGFQRNRAELAEKIKFQVSAMLQTIK